jgi:hypothetical protein
LIIIAFYSCGDQNAMMIGSASWMFRLMHEPVQTRWALKRHQLRKRNSPALIKTHCFMPGFALGI